MLDINVKTKIKEKDFMLINGKLVPFSEKSFLGDALNFDLYQYQFKNDQFKKIVAHVWEEFQTAITFKIKSKNKNKYRDCVRHILFNVYLGHGLNLPVRYSRSNFICPSS